MLFAARFPGKRDGTQKQRAQKHFRARAPTRNDSTTAGMSAAKKTKVWHLPALGPLFAECSTPLGAPPLVFEGGSFLAFASCPPYSLTGACVILAYARRDHVMAAIFVETLI